MLWDIEQAKTLMHNIALVILIAFADNFLNKVDYIVLFVQFSQQLKCLAVARDQVFELHCCVHLTDF